MDKTDEELFSQFLGDTNEVETDVVEADWVDSLYDSINTTTEGPSQHQELYDEMSKLKTIKLERQQQQQEQQTEGVQADPKSGGDLSGVVKAGELKEDDMDSNDSFTIPVDSPSMHMFVHSDDELDHQNDSVAVLESITSTSNTSINIKPPTFDVSTSHIPLAPKIDQSKQNGQRKSSKVIRKERSSSTQSPPISLHSQMQNVPQQIHMYTILRDGLRKYCGSLYAAEPDKSLEKRAEYMSNYFLERNIKFSTKNVGEAFSLVRKDEHEFNLTNKIPEAAGLFVEIRDLLVESVKRRKSYTRRKSAKPSQKSFNKSLGGSLSATTTPKLNMNTSSSNSSGGIVNTIKIGAFLNQRNLTVEELNIHNLTAIADYSKISQNKEDERYIYQLRAQNIGLKNCIDDIYGNSLPLINYPLTYSKVPLDVSPAMSIDLENDRMISYVDVLLDLSDMILPFDRNSPAVVKDNTGNYTKIIQLKSITRIYDHGTLIYRKCDPVTGFFPSDVSNVSKIILPLQAKFWAGFINDYHNGIVNQSVFENLKITHTLLPNDDIIKFKTGLSAPIYSFIWEFTVPKPDQQSVPYSVIVSKLDKRFSPVSATIPLPQSQTVNASQPTHKLRLTVPKKGASMGSPMSAFNPPLIGSNVFYKNPNHSSSVLTTQRGNALGIRTVSGAGHKRTRSRSVNEIDFLSDVQSHPISANSTFINNNIDPFTPVSPNAIMNHPVSVDFTNGFESVMSTPKSGMASATQSSFDLSLHSINNGRSNLSRED